MSYPNSDELMTYDFNKHRYILTNKCVLDELNENLAERLNMRGSASAENVINSVLDLISLNVYNFIYSHTIQRFFVERILAKAPSARNVIKEAMKQQVLYFLVNGQIDKYAGVDVKKGQAMLLKDLRGERTIDPQAIMILDNPLEETKVSLLFRGRYSTFDDLPHYEEESY